MVCTYSSGPSMTAGPTDRVTLIIMIWPLLMTIGTNIFDDKCDGAVVKQLVIDCNADEEEDALHEEANGGIEGGDLLYQIPVCVYRMPIVPQ